ncbi:MAG: DUF1553 domain-containing protein [Isosphaeraceae bacterium]
MTMTGWIGSILFVLTASAHDDLPPPVERVVTFRGEVRPIFERACLSCHGPDKQRGGFRLDRKGSALKGGGLGPAILPRDSAASPLIQYVAGVEPDLRMPPKGPALTRDEVGILRAWIDRGAEWPDDAQGPDPRDWWSLRPIVKPAVPSIPNDWANNPIDHFIASEHAAKGLKPAPEADRRTLIRRLSFDLIGLPPTPGEIEAFQADGSPDAYERLVDRLLASPHHGERWARHWLDVVHYGDTHGYDKDKPRPNAWPYRDYVIRALNSDTPYARFVQEQLAGDILYPGSGDAIRALGFISAGPWDFIGHAEVPESKIDGKIARHLDRDDMVANTTNTFLSLTAQCAQCHDHKFDPITQEDYYSLQAVFAAIDRADKPVYDDPRLADGSEKLADEEARLKDEKARLEALLAQQGGQALRDLDRAMAEAREAEKAGFRPEFGYHSAIEPVADKTKWVQIDLGAPKSIGLVTVAPCHDDFNGIGDGFGFPPRFRIEMSDDPEFRGGVINLLDKTAYNQQNPGLRPVEVDAGGRVARYIRVTATLLAPRSNDYIFALAEISATDPAGRDLARNALVTATDSIEIPPRWRKQNLVDGYAPGYPGDSLAVLASRRSRLIAATTDGAARAALDAANAGLRRIADEQAAMPRPGLVYAGTAFRGTGAFSGTGGMPRPISILTRGDVRRPGREVGPGAIKSVGGVARFAIDPARPEGDRRAALALWITSNDNPLTWRSIVNRAWRYHFGRGLVDTPSDFGRMGQLPSHPQLLDWLAAEFRDSGGSLKALHRRIVTSATYRQASIASEEALARDAENALFSHANRRKLDAESLRDGMLAISGRLDRRMFGPAFQDFRIDKPEHSPHYEYDRHDADDPASHRRAIYRFLVRSQPEPFMSALDCADPSMQVDRRNETQSALQALALLNDDLTLVLSRHFAERVESASDDPKARIREAFRLAIGRDPSTSERESIAAFAQRFGLANACRLLFNLNEFLFLD